MSGVAVAYGVVLVLIGVVMALAGVWQGIAVLGPLGALFVMGGAVMDDWS